METFRLVAPCLFGLERLVADELREMGMAQVMAENGRVLFEGDSAAVARANIGSRFAERILLVLGSAETKSFDDLFQFVKALPLERFIGRTDAFPVKGYSLQSKLHSVPDCQAIIKKAIVERLKEKYVGIDWFSETGSQIPIRFRLFKDEVTLMIDTTGEGLHKRGYRRQANAAPIKETLAAAMCSLARVDGRTTLYDPFCGSGTILIEGALLAANIAPGLLRSFACEHFSFVGQQTVEQARASAREQIRAEAAFRAFGSDIDDQALKLTMENAQKAGVGAFVSVKHADISAFRPGESGCTVVTNPPYGERLLDIEQARQLYQAMGRVFSARRGKKYYIISPDDQFETHFGRAADRRRKLYNGNLACQVYMFFK